MKNSKGKGTQQSASAPSTIPGAVTMPAGHVYAPYPPGSLFGGTSGGSVSGGMSATLQASPSRLTIGSKTVALDFEEEKSYMVVGQVEQHTKLTYITRVYTVRTRADAAEQFQMEFGEPNVRAMFILHEYTK